MCELMILFFSTLFVPGLSSALDCFHSENIECVCLDKSLVCTGVQEELSEIESLFANVSNLFVDSELQYLSLNIQNLTLQQNFTFENFNALRNVTLGNGLRSLHNGIFSGLGSTLISLNLEHNSLETMSPFSFSKLINLRELNLNFNGLTELNESVFYNLSRLKLLSLSGNYFNKLEDDVFDYLPSIQTLVVNKNNFSSLSDISIESSSLVTLTVQHGFMNGSLGQKSLSGIPNLENVDLSYNRLSGVDSYSLAELKSLKTLNLSNNMIEYLRKNAFASVYNLRSLDLSHNQLLLVMEKSFLNLTQLKYLDLRENRLEAFLQEYTVDLLSLEKIFLQDNRIKVVTSGTFSNSSHLQELNLSGNILHCNCGLFHFASFLANSSHIIVVDKDSIICASPAVVSGIPMIDVDFASMNCELSEITDDYYFDYSSPENFTTPLIASSQMSYLKTEPTTLNISSTLLLSTEHKTNSIIKSISFDSTMVEEITTASTASEITNAGSSLETTASQVEDTGKNSTFVIVKNETDIIETSTSLFISDSQNDSTFSPTSKLQLSTENEIAYSSLATTASEFEDTGENLTFVSVKNETDTTETTTSLFITNSQNDSTFSPTSKLQLSTENEIANETSSLATSASEVEDSGENSTFVSVKNEIDVIETTTSLFSPDSQNDSTFSSMVEFLHTETISMLPNTKPYWTNTETSMVEEDKVVSTEISTVSKTTEEEINFTSVTSETNLTTQSSLSELTEKPNDGVLISTIMTPISSNFTSLDFSILPLVTNQSIIEIDLMTDKDMHVTVTDQKTAYTPLSSVTEKSTTQRIESVVSSSTTGHKETLSVDILNFTVTNELCIRWAIGGSHPTNLMCRVSARSNGFSRSKGLQCPPEGSEISQCLPYEVVTRFCITVEVNRKIVDKSCEVELLGTTATQPSTNIKYTSISTTDSSTSQSKVVVSSTTNIVSFKVTEFDVILYPDNSVFVAWFVSIQEPLEVCHLKLLLTTNQNYTEGKFKCVNGSYLHDIQGDVSKVCILSFHKIYKEDMQCKLFTDPFIGYQSSRTKDSGYKNSSLIAVICLLIICLIIIVVLVMKNLLKKRTESDRYNVCVEEQNVRKRWSSNSKRAEPFVRYSYTMKPQEEL